MENLRDVTLSPTANLHSIVIESGASPTAILRMNSNPDPQGKVTTFEASPGVTIVAAGGRLSDGVSSRTDYKDLAILYDADRKRVLAGPTNLVRSVFTRLMFLDRRYSQRFDRDDDERGYGGERVTTWKIDWNAP
jgi:hypothetical protein